MHNFSRLGMGLGMNAAIYLDGMGSDWLIENNSFIDCKISVAVNGGRNVTVRRNAFAITRDGVCDNGCMGWQCPMYLPPPMGAGTGQPLCVGVTYGPPMPTYCNCSHCTYSYNRTRGTPACECAEQHQPPPLYNGTDHSFIIFKI